MTSRGRKKRMETGPDSAGQSGATQQISDTPIVDSESVEELAEEGNAFEANAIYGVEDKRDPGVSEVINHEVPEDDVPDEYLDNGEHLASDKKFLASGCRTMFITRFYITHLAPHTLALSRESPLSADQSQMCECLRETAKMLSVGAPLCATTSTPRTREWSTTT
jgi:hypothetical protein